MPLKTLFLNPPSFENFDGGAGSRWPATREIESYWYPVWLAYPTGMLEGARLLDAPPHHVTAEETIRICKDYELLVLFTSTPGFPGDIRLAEAIKDAIRTSRSRSSDRTSASCPRNRCRSDRSSTSSAARNSTTPSSSTPTASRSRIFSAFRIARTAASCTIPIVRRSRTWTPCRT